MNVTPVVLAGGSGSRLWPLSREHYPKQLLPLHGDDTLLQQTLHRLDQAGNSTLTVTPPIVVCNEEHRFLIAEQIRGLGMRARSILLEPVGRNTAPALTIAALEAAQPTDVLMVMPADHVIRDLKAFGNGAAVAAGLAEQGYISTFGIVADRPETGYGYIRKGPALAAEGAYRVDRFVEKPDADTAQGYLDSGDYYWNSGIFVVRADIWLQAIRRFQPAMATACEAAWNNSRADQDFRRIDATAFAASPSDSIDYAVMEHLAEAEDLPGAALIPLQAGWSDVGAWSALWEISESDMQGNVTQGDVFYHDTHNSLVVAEHRFVAAVGLDDAVIIETADALLVTRRGRSQDVKRVVEWLKQHDRDECRSHRRVYRPWGSYEGLENGERYQVKRLKINPGAAISLQKHHHRAEHWIVVRGTARVTRDEETFLISENQSTYIPLGAVHRLENPGKVDLEIIEVQSGSYLGEDDIVRFEDIYNRVES